MSIVTRKTDREGSADLCPVILPTALVIVVCWWATSWRPSRKGPRKGSGPARPPFQQLLAGVAHGKHPRRSARPGPLRSGG